MPTTSPLSLSAVLRWQLPQLTYTREMLRASAMLCTRLVASTAPCSFSAANLALVPLTPPFRLHPVPLLISGNPLRLGGCPCRRFLIMTALLAPRGTKLSATTTVYLCGRCVWRLRDGKLVFMTTLPSSFVEV